MSGQFRQERERLGFKFKAQMGAEAIKELLRRVNVDRLAEELREKICRYERIAPQS